MRHSIMRKLVYIIAATILLWPVLAAATEAPLVAPELKIHQIKSKFIDQIFEIYVKVPTQLADGSERFPVLYLTDSYDDGRASNTEMNAHSHAHRRIGLA